MEKIEAVIKPEMFSYVNVALAKAGKEAI